MKIVWIALIALLVLTALVELALRYFFGFGRPLIYQADPAIGYLLAPDQATRRFGNRIVINQYSMRTEPIAPQRSDQTLRVLMIGDSVANGGWWTDQANTISAVLKSKLISVQASLALSGKSSDQASGSETTSVTAVEVLNASANSWGPRNELAYLERFGLFNANYLVLIINTDDLFSTTPTSLVVGVDRNYPDRLPQGAIAEVIQRYILPQPTPSPELAKVRAERGDRVGKNLAAIQAIDQLAQQAGAKFLLVMTPLLREVEAPGPKDYELEARLRLRQFTQAQQIDYVDGLTGFQSVTVAQSLYHDHIHLSAAGNQLVSDWIEQWIQRPDRQSLPQ
ncbi:SGNH/GDSL hydrolase family protein [filamentous cyanobacterium LEGE 11480]|uniref:SGNH/GDSL hydrolase family protein n=1 Tax=Romeriopsis navalis LEGE 11480 TaxID=2777977 RepID=A0A928VMB6_9CYAN|nr:GDSL-type esterase/lipase family protein [Romeriopsis navalis]MBE9029140.1 SGNH/GDSL hydrolase family protein [Romeriopsis navalis LEGE 11480]